MRNRINIDIYKYLTKCKVSVHVHASIDVNINLIYFTYIYRATPGNVRFAPKTLLPHRTIKNSTAFI